jgi:hypothetical protein
VDIEIAARVVGATRVARVNFPPCPGVARWRFSKSETLLLVISELRQRFIAVLAAHETPKPHNRLLMGRPRVFIPSAALVQLNGGGILKGFFLRRLQLAAQVREIIGVPGHCFGWQNWIFQGYVVAIQEVAPIVLGLLNVVGEEVVCAVPRGHLVAELADGQCCDFQSRFIFHSKSTDQNQ